MSTDPKIKCVVSFFVISGLIDPNVLRKIFFVKWKVKQIMVNIQ